MGKSTNGLGVFRGKVGAVVFQVNKGENASKQVIRAYQPIVSNPRTDAQLAQRAKMTLAGQLSSVCDASVLSAFRSGSNRKNRGMFVSNIIRASEATKSNGQFTAAVPASAIKFSDGGFANPFTLTPNIGQGSSILNVDINASTGTVGEYGLRVVALLVHTADGADRYDAAVFTDVIPQSAQSSTTLDLTRVISETGANNVYVYAVPFKLTDRSAVSADFMASEGEVISSGLNRSISVSGYDFGRTQYIGVAPIVDIHTLTFAATSNWPTGVEIDGELVPLDVSNHPAPISLTAGTHQIIIGGTGGIQSYPIKGTIGEQEIVISADESTSFTMPSANATMTFGVLTFSVETQKGYLIGNTFHRDNTMGNVTTENATVNAGREFSNTATPASGYEFVGWYKIEDGTATRLSTQTTMQIGSVTKDWMLYAIFHNPEGD